MRKNRTVSDEILIASYNAKNRTVSDEMLTQIFARVGRRYGYDDVKAEFCPFPDFKVKWMRSYKWISFEISDYLDRAPQDVLEDLAGTLFEKVSGNNADYSESFIRYLNEPEPRKSNQRDFVSRKKRMNDTTIGDFHDLNDCVNRLRGMGLIPPDLECILCWDSSNTKKASGCSVIQRVAWVNTALDQKGVPENVLDYVVYTMLAHIMVGFNGSHDGYEFMRLDAMYPMREDALRWLEENGFRI